MIYSTPTPPRVSRLALPPLPTSLLPPLPVLPPLALLQQSRPDPHFCHSHVERSPTEDTHSYSTHDAAFSALQSSASDAVTRSGTLPTSAFPSEYVSTATESGFGAGIGPGMGTTGSGTGFSVPRRLPLTPVQLQRENSYGFGDEKREIERTEKREDGAPSGGHHRMPRSPSGGEMVVHRDGGVRLDYSSPQVTPARRELPPPYANYSI